MSDRLLSLDPAHPRFTAELFGHEAAEAELLGAYRSGRLAHAWLLAGPPGIGKATLAYRFARFLLGQGAGLPTAGLFGGPIPVAETLAIDPASAIFRRVAGMGHGDLLTIERTPNPRTGKMRKEIAVEDVRRMPEFFSKTAAEGGWRVAIVDAADELNRSSANALLKIVEEPPARSVILIVAHAPGSLLPTIRSRCRRLVLKPLEVEAMRAFMAQRLPELDAATRDLVLGLAEGSPGRAMGLAEQDAAALFGELLALLGGLQGHQVSALHRFAEALGKRAGDGGYRLGLGLLDWWLARLARAGATGALPPELVAGEGEVLGRLASAAGADRWLAAREEIARLAARGEAVNLDRKQVVLSAFSVLGGVLRG
ncbi:MAG: DNA polymerase III subunit delta' [Alphaproteobacteria bacterium]|nr:DNA polymerase III subunit delta' [Alphaproteobacteria bacterium]